MKEALTAFAVISMCMTAMAQEAEPAIHSLAEEADSIPTDTMSVDWYVSPTPTVLLPSFEMMTEMFRQADAASGLTDYSESDNFEIAEPSFAWVNITGTSSLPTSTESSSS